MRKSIETDVKQLKHSQNGRSDANVESPEESTGELWHSMQRLAPDTKESPSQILYMNYKTRMYQEHGERSQRTPKSSVIVSKNPGVSQSRRRLALQMKRSRNARNKFWYSVSVPVFNPGQIETSSYSSSATAVATVVATAVTVTATSSFSSSSVGASSAGAVAKSTRSLEEWNKKVSKKQERKIRIRQTTCMLSPKFHPTNTSAESTLPHVQ